jgi:hypothetical protein
MPGAYMTSDDLVREVLSRLGVLASGQAPDPEDYAYVQTSLDSIRRKLAALEIVYIADINSIPGAYFTDIADIVAGELSTKFGVTPDDYSKLLSKGLGGVQGVDVGYGAAAISLRQMTRGRATGEPLRVEYM